MATTLKVRLAIAAAAIALAQTLGSNLAVSRIYSTNNGSISLSPGYHTGLQQAFAWDARCRTVPVAFSGHTTAGSLKKVGGMFRVLGGNCAGRAVRGFTVVYVAPKSFKGTAQVAYTLKAANNTNYFRFTRSMIVR